MADLEYNFIDTVPEDLQCSICSETLKEPRLIECCGHHFCQKCLSDWLKTNPVCPYCRSCNVVHIEDKSIKRKINELRVRCFHCKAGCTWEGQLGDLQSHLQSQQGCGYKQVECINKCKTGGVVCRFQRKDLQRHLVYACPLRKHTCEYCGHNNTYEHITQLHYQACPELPLECPNKCGVIRIRRKAMSAHRHQCPLEKLMCPNTCVVERKHMPAHRLQCPLEILDCPNRCGKKRKRKDMPTHRQKCPLEVVQCTNECGMTGIERHELPTHRKYCEVVMSLNEIKSELESKEATIKHLKAEVESKETIQLRLIFIVIILATILTLTLWHMFK